jgi:hypothetical protein
MFALHPPKLPVALAWLSIPLVLAGCRGQSDEGMILEVMRDIGHYAEVKDVPNIMIHLDDDYTDFEGRNKKETENMIQEYFGQYGGIVVNLLGTRVEDLVPPGAAVQSDIALSSGAAKALRQLVRVSTDNYRLNLKLIKIGGGWKIRYAEWRPIGLNELLFGPE